MAEKVSLSEEEKKLLALAVKTLIRSIAVSQARSGIPLVQQAYAKQVDTLHVLTGKINAL